jgi:ribosomal protein S12
MDRGLHFKPPNTLHPGSENQVIFSKLLIALRQLFREDEKPDEEKLKSEKLQASVQARISEQSGKFTDKKLKSAFQKRVEAKKREDD